MNTEVPEESKYDLSPPPPRFDANASATAKPVEPIGNRSFASFRGALSGLGKRLSGQPRALILVIVIGLFTGAIGGMLLVDLGRGSAPSEDPGPSTMSAVSGISATEAEQLDTFAAELSSGSARIQSIGSGRRGRSRSNGIRAYRVAVIR